MCINMLWAHFSVCVWERFYLLFLSFVMCSISCSVCNFFFSSLEKGIYFTFVFFICRYEQICSEHRQSHTSSKRETHRGVELEQFSVVLFVRILSFCRISHYSNQLKSCPSHIRIKYVYAHMQHTGSVLSCTGYKWGAQAFRSFSFVGIAVAACPLPLIFLLSRMHWVLIKQKTTLCSILWTFVKAKMKDRWAHTDWKCA